MISNLQLVAFSPNTQGEMLSIIPLTDDLQKSMHLEWNQQLKEYCNGVTEIEFNAAYKPEENERFSITGFNLPDYLETNREGLNTLTNFQANEESLQSLHGLIAYATKDGQEVVLFQRFTRSHVINPGRFFFIEQGTFRSALSSCLTLGKKLDAVYFPTHQKLLFANFRNANSILGLAEYYQEASEEDIRDILSNNRLATENVDRFAVNAPQWFRVRFAMLRDSAVLENHTPSEIRTFAHGYLDIRLEGSGSSEQIVFPSDRAEAKRLLQFLNEELYKGPITEKLYETNSKKEAV